MFMLLDTNLFLKILRMLWSKLLQIFSKMKSPSFMFVMNVFFFLKKKYANKYLFTEYRKQFFAIDFRFRHIKLWSLEAEVIKIVRKNSLKVNVREKVSSWNGYDSFEETNEKPVNIAFSTQSLVFLFARRSMYWSV